MALVSSLSPSAQSPYDLSAAPYSNSSPEPPQIRQLPTLPSASNSAGRRTASSSSLGGGGGSYSTGGGGRPLPSPYPSRSPSAPPFLEARSTSTPPTSTRPFLPTSSSSLSNPPSSSRISRTPSPGVSSHSHSYSQSSSASGAPRLAPIQFSSGPNPPPPNAYSSHGQPQHPHFQPQQFPSLVYANNTHAFPHPQYPFIPSPHPHAFQATGPYSPGFQGGNDALHQQHQQHQAMLLQQAHLQQQQWQMEMMRNQAAAAAGQPVGQQYEWNGQQQQQGPNSSSRRRATSGPNPASQSPQFYTTPLSYPPSPNPSHQHQYQQGVPPIPSFPGAMLPKVGHGDPTPPGSVEGREAAQGYHPYRRGGASGGDGSKGMNAGRSQSTGAPAMSAQQSHASSSSMSSLPSSSSANSNSTSATSHARSESSGSLSMQNFPPLPKSTASPSSTIYAGAAQQNGAKNSSSSVNAPSARTSTRSTPTPTPPPPPPPFARSRTDSENSARSVSGSFRPGSTTSSQKSDEAPRASTPVQSTTASAVVAGKKPSPLSQQLGSRVGTPTSDRPSTPGTARGRTSMAEDDEDSDDTASATTAQQQVDTPKGKKGMAHKFKKAFGGGGTKSISPSPSSNGTFSLTAAELEGKGAKDSGKARAQRDSSSSIESSSPRTPPNIHDSLPSIAAESSKPPPTGRRFGILNSKLNSSTDNISISSTVSSASMMIRKLGQMGKLARRNSLMSLTKAFKGNKDEDGDKVSKKDKKKGLVATANVSHVTAEVEGSTHVAGISPAAALAKKHQQQYAEQEAAAAGAAALVPPRSFAVHARTDSNASDVSVKSARGGWGRSKSTDDVVEGGTRAAEKEKDKLKSRKSRKWGFGSKSDDSISVTDENPISRAEQGAFDDQTPRQSLEVLAGPATNGAAYATYGGSYFDDDGSVESPANFDDEYEPSLRGAPPVPRRDAKAVRGILKGAGTYNQEDYSLTRPAFPRDRASSFHAQTQQNRSTSPRRIPSEAQVDGRLPSSPSIPVDFSASPDTMGPPKSPYANPALNASAPVLKSTSPIHPIRSASTPGGNGRRIIFAQNLSVHTTWPAAVYDRRAEPATCNRLTPTLAQRIKEELNAFKMEEMEVHPTSRQLTHFFV